MTLELFIEFFQLDAVCCVSLVFYSPINFSAFCTFQFDFFAGAFCHNTPLEAAHLTQLPKKSQWNFLGTKLFLEKMICIYKIFANITRGVKKCLQQ